LTVGRQGSGPHAATSRTQSRAQLQPVLLSTCGQAPAQNDISVSHGHAVSPVSQQASHFFPLSQLKEETSHQQNPHTVKPVEREVEKPLPRELADPRSVRRGKPEAAQASGGKVARGQRRTAKEAWPGLIRPECADRKSSRNPREALRQMSSAAFPFSTPPLAERSRRRPEHASFARASAEHFDERL
jgi:hypothetical protein